MPLPPLPRPDLDHVLAHTQGLWEDLRGQRLFITGGTGFFGIWLLESFCHANDQFGLQASATVLTRNPQAFQHKAPHIAMHSAIHLHKGEISSFVFPAGRFDHVIHAAIDYGAPLELFVSTVEGTRRTLEFAVHAGAARYLLASSGAVYGRQPPELTHLPEDYCGAPQTTQIRSAYGEAKRASEFLCAAYHDKYDLHAVIARGFAFVGPCLPLDRGSAMGNFISDALQGGPIRICGDGTPMRSYLYSADLAVWLWTILLRGLPVQPYNVGSETAYSISQVAQIVADEVNPNAPITIARPQIPDQPIERYVPFTMRAHADLGLSPRISIRDGIRRTAAWYATQLK